MLLKSVLQVFSTTGVLLAVLEAVENINVIHNTTFAKIPGGSLHIVETTMITHKF